MAHQGGYYEIPRAMTTEELGERLGADRRTAEDHLRRAEKKMADVLAEHVSLLH